MYLHSPGGIISSGLAIFDTMKYLGCDISTYCIGMAASMASLLLSAGTKGKRYALPHSRIMIHQPHGGVIGTSADINLQAKEIIICKSAGEHCHTANPMKPNAYEAKSKMKILSINSQNAARKVITDVS